MIEFASKQWTLLPGRGWMAIVPCDQERPRDNPGLVGQRVLIDGQEYVVQAVGRHLPAYPIRKGELIDLLVAPAPFNAMPLRTKVIVRYRDGTKETAEVCEVDWSIPDEQDKYSPLPEHEIVEFWVLPSQ